MSGHGGYKLFGVYVSQPVRDALADHFYETAGVIEFDEYFDPTVSTVPTGDPGADATDEFISSVVTEFATLYDTADFDAAKAVDTDSFVLTHLAADPTTIASARERFQAAATIQETDTRTVHTAILDARLSETA
ncbi:hypothetical protein ACLI4Z_14225 [Natrialbaceae archaeon A-arb3/5]